uniref:Uncharacterized protein n=1 Tax=Romanomermis culicivorax TaxID=13658 RepID=A0A915K4K5_ROMCU
MLRVIILSTLVAQASAVICQNPSSHYGQLLGHPRALKCEGGRDGQCVAAVMKLCNPLGNGEDVFYMKTEVADQWCKMAFNEHIIWKGGSGMSNDVNGFYVIN